MQTDSSLPSGRIRFGDFEVDVRSHELRRFGRKVRLQEKSFLVLNELLKRPGQVVTREELAAALWPGEYVDAEHGLNTAVRRLREALGDSADEARFVETLPKLGYRFIGAIEEVRSEQAPPPASIAPLETPARPSRRAAPVAAAILVAVALALVLGLVTRSRSTRAEAETAAAPGSTPATADPVHELLERARYLRDHKRLAEAKTFVEEALKLDPRNANALGGLAMHLIAEGKEEQGRETARRALEIDPKAFEAHRALGNLARRAGAFATAERHFRRAVEAAPTDVKSRSRLARHLLESGRAEEARQQMLETRRLEPDDPDVQNIWVDYAFRVGDYESAIREGELWLAIWAKQLGESGGTASVRDTLGLAYVGARRHEEALAQFRVIDPNDDLRVALALGHAGQTAEARTILTAHEQAQAAARAAGAPADPKRAGALAMAYVVLGDFDRAFENLNRQLAARWFPGWLNSTLFHTIRQDPRWPAFEQRLETEFLGREENGGSENSPPFRDWMLQLWPRPAKGVPPRPGA